jgi:hypothetical protein
MDLLRAALGNERSNAADLHDLSHIRPNWETTFEPANLIAASGGQSSPTFG